MASPNEPPMPSVMRVVSPVTWFWMLGLRAAPGSISVTGAFGPWEGGSA